MIPAQTILIENPIAVTKNAQNPAAATAFVKYLLSKPGQKLWAIEGYRPVLPGAAQAAAGAVPHPAQLFTIATLGGWTKVTRSSSTRPSGIVTKIEEGLGQSTASSRWRTAVRAADRSLTDGAAADGPVASPGHVRTLGSVAPRAPRSSI